jgi:CubicO group peptidase (beta-lactamase class C family)
MKFIVLVLIGIGLLNTACAVEERIEMKIDEVFEEFSEGNSPGVSAAVRRGEEALYQKCFGLADLETKTEISSQTNFRLASITKQFTSYSILLLENDDKLSLSDKLDRYFPELPEFAENISIKNILQHTSGLLDYEDFVDKNDTLQLKDKDVLEILTKQDTTYFLPGSAHRYSNSGYAILALLVERISGKSFAEFLNVRIFKPLKMKYSVAFEDGISKVEDRAFGYAKNDSGFAFTDQSLTSAVLGDGGIYSSTIDLLKWDDEINRPTLLPREKFDKIFVRGIDSEGEEFDYGFGWRLDPYKNHYRPYHTGSTSGFSNIYMKLPDLDLTIILLINIRDYDAKGYAEKIADIFLK